MPHPLRPLFLALLLSLTDCQGASRSVASAPGAPATLVTPGAEIADSPSLAQALRSQDWTTAQDVARQAADPLAPQLVDWLRMQAPNAAAAAEIATFLDAHPGWPSRSVLTARLSQALVTEHDPATLIRLCTETRLAATTPSLATLQACAAAARPTDADFAALLRHAWRSGLGRSEDASTFLAQWSAVLTPDDDAARFDGLLARGALSAAQQMQARVDATRRLRLALRRDPAGSIAPAQQRAQSPGADPAMLQDLAHALRRQSQLDAAIALWNGPAAGLSDAAAVTERLALARDLLSAGRDAEARRMAEPGAIANPVARAEALFLAGWIAWRDHDRTGAAAQFHALAALGNAPLTQSRAHYWLARVAATPAETQAEDRAAAAYPTTFYGQLAIARRLNGDAAPAFDPFTTAGLKTAAALRFDRELSRALAALPQPQWNRDQALDFAARPFSRAAALLVAWEQPVPARTFLLRTAMDEADPTLRAMAAAQALHLGLPETAVAIARLSGRDGALLLDSGWPAPYAVATDPALPAGLVSGLTRQESSFDSLATSPAGARGLMQLLPGTANEIAERHPEAGVAPPVSVAMLLDVPQVNLALGKTYLATLVTRFGGNLAPAIAAYDAGPHRVDLWMGSPLPGPVTGSGEATVDWIESVPFNETRNYIQRVLENAAIYRARQGARP